MALIQMLKTCKAKLLCTSILPLNFFLFLLPFSSPLSSSFLPLFICFILIVNFVDSLIRYSASRNGFVRLVQVLVKHKGINLNVTDEVCILPFSPIPFYLPLFLLFLLSPSFLFLSLSLSLRSFSSSKKRVILILTTTRILEQPRLWKQYPIKGRERRGEWEGDEERGRKRREGDE